MERSDVEQSEIDAINAVELSQQDEADIDEALRHARDPLDEEVAVSAYYLAERELLMITLKTGQRLAIPREDLQGLADAEPELIGRVEIDMFGLALHWEELDVDHLVDALRSGLYGSKRWLAQLDMRRRQKSLLASYGTSTMANNGMDLIQNSK